MTDGKLKSSAGYIQNFEVFQMFSSAEHSCWTEALFSIEGDESNEQLSMTIIFLLLKLLKLSNGGGSELYRLFY